jgi:phosphatidylglycerophosphatase C
MIPKKALADVLLALGEAVFAEPHGIIATDADGTLWSGDVGVDAFQAFLASGELHPAVEGALRAEAEAHGVSAELSIRDQALALHEAEVDGTYPGDRACAMMAWIYAGLSPTAMRERARATVAALDLANRFQPEALAVLRWAAERSVPVVVVSASPWAVVDAAVELLPGPRPHIIAMQPAEENDALAPRIREPIPYGAGKAEALRQQFPGRPILAALGDSGFDGEMLRLSRIPLAVRPKDSLRRALFDLPTLTELSA